MNKPSTNIPCFDSRVIAEKLSSKLGVGLIIENINHPTPEIAQQIYSNFLRVALEIPEYSLNTLPLTASESSEYDAEMHRKSVSTIIIYQVISAFIADCTEDRIEFSMCDLVRPSADIPRFKRILSFLVDFLRLLPVAKPIFNNVNEEFRDKYEEKNKLQEELMVMEKRKSDLIAQQSLRKRRENDLLNEIQKVQEELNGIVKEYNSINGKKEEFLKITEDTIEQRKRLELEIEGKKKMRDHLAEEIMSSPNKMRNEMETRKKQIIELEKFIIQSKAELEKCRKNVEICAHSEKQMMWINQKIIGLTSEKKSIQELIENVNDEERKWDEFEQNFKFACDKKEAANKRIIEMTESHNKMKQEHLNRILALKNKAENITKTIAEMHNIQPQAAEDINDKRSYLVSIKNIKNEFERNTIEEMDVLAKKFQNIIKGCELNEKLSLEQSRAINRLNEKLKNCCQQSSQINYTFSSSTINEESIIERDFYDKENMDSENVFK